MNQDDPKKILIAGGGLVGGTLALDYADAFGQAEIAVYEPGGKACADLKAALSANGCESVQVILGLGEAQNFANGVGLLDICTPIDKMGAVQGAFGWCLADGALSTNRGSAQQPAKDLISPHVREGTHHFGVHPVVGRERKAGAPLQIYRGTFKNQTAIIDAPDAVASEEAHAAHAKLIRINERLGFNVKTLPAPVHDALLGSASNENTGGLQTMVRETQAVKTGLGATMMRAASGTTSMWLPIFEFNKGAIGGAAEVQQKQMDALASALEAGDDTVFALVEKAHEFRMGWPDAQEAVEPLEVALEEAGADGEVRQVVMPLLFSVARTLGFQERVEGLKPALAEYGHEYTDLLNSSIKNSTLGAKYDPAEVSALFAAHREELREAAKTYGGRYGAYKSAVEEIGVDFAATQELNRQIKEAAEILGEHSVAPRRFEGGDGFEPMERPMSMLPPDHYDL